MSGSMQSEARDLHVALLLTGERAEVSEISSLQDLIMSCIMCGEQRFHKYEDQNSHDLSCSLDNVFL